MSRSWEAKSLAIVALSTLKAGLRGETRLLGIDLGAKTIGLALSDVSRMVATPYRTLDRNKFSRNARELETVIDEQDVGGVVLGWPVEMDGGEGSRCRATRRFAENLIARRDIPIAFWDERLSTAAVERLLVVEVDMTRKRRKEVIDKTAAAYILQGALDAI